MNIVYNEDISLDKDLIDELIKAAEICISEEGIDPDVSEISLSVVSPEEIRKLNAEYRNNDKVTDVLSFPQYDDLKFLDNTEEICLGDVVVNNEAIISQAEEFGHSYEREMVYLFVHSVLHLLGYDHMERNDKAEMRKREEIVMTKLGLERRIIERK